MKYTKQDWIDGKVALIGNPEKKDKANRFFRSVYPEATCTALFDEPYYVYCNFGECICWDVRRKTDIPTCDIDDIIWEENCPEKQPENCQEINYDYINPSHYKQSSIETIDMMVAIWGKEKVADYCEINSYKYFSRLGKKPNCSIQDDLGKAHWYLNKAKELRG